MRRTTDPLPPEEIAAAVADCLRDRQAVTVRAVAERLHSFRWVVLLSLRHDPDVRLAVAATDPAAAKALDACLARYRADAFRAPLSADGLAVAHRLGIDLPEDGYFCPGLADEPTSALAGQPSRRRKSWPRVIALA